MPAYYPAARGNGQGLRVPAQIVLAIVVNVKTIHRTTIEQ